MKKLSIFLLALVACAGTMLASDTSVGGIWYNFDDEYLTAEVTYRGDRYDSYSNEYTGEVVIPASVTYRAQTYTVTSIGDDAFYKCSGLTSVTIPNSVTSIGYEAFWYCTGLISVTIPNSVTSIGNYAFSSCSGLTTIDVAPDNPNYCSEDGVLFNKDKSILIQYPAGKQGSNYTIPSSVTSIGDGAFEGCSNLTSVTIPNSVTSIGWGAFANCRSLTSVTIPNSVTSIGVAAFYNCTGLTSPVYNAHVFAFMPTSYSGAYTIPDGIESIAGYAFYGCSSLTSVTIPNSVTSIEFGTFTNCSSLTSVTIPNSVTSIGNSAFFGCIGLTSVTIPSSVTSIGDYAFYNCYGLTSVTIPNSVTSIVRGAFAYCSGLTSVTIPNSVTSIGEAAFDACRGLTSITNYATTPQTIDGYVFRGVNKSTCVLNVPKESVSLYQAADVWKEFTNIVGVDVPGEDPEEPIETVEGDYTINYVDKDSQDLYNHVVTLYVPIAPAITGFTFIGWDVVAGHLTDGITLQAVYQADVPSSAPAVYTIPANPAQKLIKNGNVYILTEDKTYTITGTQVK